VKRFALDTNRFLLGTDRDLFGTLLSFKGTIPCVFGSYRPRRWLAEKSSPDHML